VTARFVLLEGSGLKVLVGTDAKQQERLYVVKYRRGSLLSTNDGEQMLKGHAVERQAFAV